jgi:DNA processing protein
MLDSRTRLALTLASLPQVGRRRLRVLLSRAGGATVSSAREVADVLREHGAGLRLKVDDPQVVDRAWQEAERLAETCWRHGWRFWILGAPDYPAGLLRLDDPPALLFVHGPNQPEQRPRVAVIGTREPSAWGEQTARACAAEVVHAGGIVVSGLAWGIDTAAHRGSVDAHGCTWATLPSGLDLVFPPSNAALAARIVEEGGALISEYPPGTRPHPTFFVERDRLQAALSQAVVVIETGLTGGTMHTVRFARAVKVPLHVAFPEGVDPASVTQVSDLAEPQQGTWQLLRDGAARVGPAEVGALTRALAGEQAHANGSEADAQRRLFE